MRVGRVIGKVTLHRKEHTIPASSLLICDVLDGPMLKQPREWLQRETPLKEAMVVFDTLGATDGDLIAICEGPEASLPFRPNIVPLDAYSAAILDHVEYE